MADKNTSKATAQTSAAEANLIRQFEAKTQECAKLYRLVNYLKGQITNFEIAAIDRDMEIERLQAAFAQAQRPDAAA